MTQSVEVLSFGDPSQRRYRFAESIVEPSSWMDHTYRNANGQQSIDDVLPPHPKQLEIIDQLLQIPGIFYVGFEGTWELHINLSCDFDWHSEVSMREQPEKPIDQLVANVLAEHTGCPPESVMKTTQKAH